MVEIQHYYLRGVATPPPSPFSYFRYTPTAILMYAGTKGEALTYPSTGHRPVTTDDYEQRNTSLNINTSPLHPSISQKKQNNHTFFAKIMMY